jgi:HK97 family phage major capsid protein
MSHNMNLDEKIAIMDGRAEQELAEKKLEIARELQSHHDQRIEKRQTRAQVASALGTGGILPTIQALTPHEKRNYSLAKALQAEAAHDKGLTLEREISESIAKDIGQVAAHGGIWVPLRISAAGLDTRTLPGGGYLTAKPVGDILDALRAATMVLRLGAQFITAVRYAPSFPVENTIMSAQWVAENGVAASDSDPSFAQRVVSGKFLSASTSVSRQLLSQASADIEQWLRSRIALSHGLALDRAAIHGAGASNEPVGLLQTSGVGDVGVGVNGGALAANHVVELERLVGAANGDTSNAGWLTNAAQRAKLRAVPEMTGGTFPIWRDNAMLGHVAETSGQIRSDLSKGTANNCSALVFGDWSKLLLFEFQGAFEVVLDEYTGKKQGLVSICSWGSYDVLIQQPAAFSACRDAI